MVSTIQEVEVSLAFIHGTGDKEFESFPRGDRLQGENPYAGFSNWQDAISPVADYSSSTNQDFIDWENARLTSEAANVVSKDNIKDTLANYSSITLQDYELVVSIEQQTAGAFIGGGSPTISTMHTTLVSLLAGQPLQTPTVNYVIRVAGVPSIGTDLEKEFNVAMQFLRIIKGAYETLNGR